MSRFTAFALLLAFVSFAAIAAGIPANPVLFAALLALVTGIALAVAKPGLAAWGPMLSRGPAKSNHVALTFDDGPDPVTTPRLLAALDAAGFRATFFVLLDRAEAHPGLVHDLAIKHEIALHGRTHSARQVFVAPNRSARQLDEAAERLATLSGKPVRYYRPPFGVISPRLYQAIARSRLALAWCSIRTLDGGGASQRYVRASVARATSGDIVLLHDGRLSTAELLPEVLNDLAKRNLSSITLSELMGPQ
jgi:peptidoglycan-N-acetylglucosamine deacetylase